MPGRHTCQYYLWLFIFVCKYDILLIECCGWGLLCYRHYRETQIWYILPNYYGFYLILTFVSFFPQFVQKFQNSCVFEQTRKKCCRSSHLSQTLHTLLSLIFLSFSHLLHGIILCKILYWKLWSLVSLHIWKAILKIPFDTDTMASLKPIYIVHHFFLF